MRRSDRGVMPQRWHRTPQTGKEKWCPVSASGHPAVMFSAFHPQKNRCLRGCKPAIMWATGACWQQSGHSCSRHNTTSCISSGTWLNHCGCCLAVRYDIIKVDCRVNNTLDSSKAHRIKHSHMLSQQSRLELRLWLPHPEMIQRWAVCCRSRRANTKLHLHQVR